MAIYVLRGSIWYVALFKMTIHLETGAGKKKKRQRIASCTQMRLLCYVDELMTNSSAGHCAHLLENEIPFPCFFLFFQPSDFNPKKSQLTDSSHPHRHVRDAPQTPPPFFSQVICSCRYRMCPCFRGLWQFLMTWQTVNWCL